MQLEIFQEIAQRSNQDGMTLPLQVHTFMSNKLKFCEKVQETLFDDSATYWNKQIDFIIITNKVQGL